MLTKSSVIDQIEITENGTVQVRQKISVYENGVCISDTFHRHTIQPGADYSNEDEKVKAICAVAHTPSVIAAFKASQTVA